MEHVTESRFFPYWKADQLDQWLARKELQGLRLEQVRFPRRFVFRETKEKQVEYYTTFCFPKESGMLDVGHQIKRELKADEVPASAVGYCQSFFRIAGPIDAETKRDLFFQRNHYLKHISKQCLLIWGIFLFISVAALIYLFLSGNEANMKGCVFFIALAIFSLLSLSYHIVGMIDLRVQRRKMHDSIA